MNVGGFFKRFRKAKPERLGELRRPRRDFVRQYDSAAPVGYETRAVAFIDILGWSKAVSASETDDVLRAALLNAVWSLAAQVQDYLETETTQQPSHDEYSQFSDSLVVSFPYREPYDLARLLKLITEFQMTMLLLGLPLRGGVTVGPLFHADAIAFGPALNQAYFLESCVAAVPRVVVDEAFNSAVEAAACSQPSHWPFVLMGDDGHYETDFLTAFARSPAVSQILDGKIEEWMHEHAENETILAKYRWLQNRWEAAMAEAAPRSDITDALPD